MFIMSSYPIVLHKLSSCALFYISILYNPIHGPNKRQLQPVFVKCPFLSPFFQSKNLKVKVQVSIFVSLHGVYIGATSIGFLNVHFIIHNFICKCLACILLYF